MEIRKNIFEYICYGFGIIFLLIGVFFWIMPVKAVTGSPIIQNEASATFHSNSATTTWVGQNIQAPELIMDFNEIKLAGCFSGGGSNDINFTFNRGSCSGITCTGTNLYSTTTSLTLPACNSTDVDDFIFETDISLYPSQQYYFTFQSDTAYRLITNSGYADGNIVGYYDGTAGDDLYFGMYGTTTDFTADVIDLDWFYLGYGTSTVKIGSQSLYAINPLCDINFPDDCKVRVNLSYEYTDVNVKLIDLSYNIIDSIDLDNDAMLRQVKLTPTTRTSTTTDEYVVAVYENGDLTSALEDVFVTWYDSTTDLTPSTFGYLVDNVTDSFKKTFPLNVLFEIAQKFKTYYQEYNAENNAMLTFNDVVPSEYSGVVSTSTIISADLLEESFDVASDNLWTEFIYPFLNAVIWLFVFLIIYFDFVNTDL